MKKKEVKLTLKKENIVKLENVASDAIKGGNGSNYQSNCCNGGGGNNGGGGGGGNYPTNGCNNTQLFTVCFPNTGALAGCW